MGWENLHPVYMLQSQETFQAVNSFSDSYDDWVEVDCSGKDHSSDGSTELGSVEASYGLGGIRNDLWDLVVPSQRTTPLLGA